MAQDCGANSPATEFICEIKFTELKMGRAPLQRDCADRFFLKLDFREWFLQHVFAVNAALEFLVPAPMVFDVRTHRLCFYLKREFALVRAKQRKSNIWSEVR